MLFYHDNTFSKAYAMLLAEFLHSLTVRLAAKLCFISHDFTEVKLIQLPP